MTNDAMTSECPMTNVQGPAGAPSDSGATFGIRDSQRNSNSLEDAPRTPHAALRTPHFDDWSLGFGHSLAIGHWSLVILLAFLALDPLPSPAAPKTITLLNVSYDPTRELFREYNTAFAKYWNQKNGQKIRSEERRVGKEC